MLSAEQKETVIRKKEYKEALILNRENNKKEIRRLKLLLEVARGDDREVLQKEIGRGNRMIIMQTSRIKALADRKIADEVGLSMSAIQGIERESLRNVPLRK